MWDTDLLTSIIMIEKIDGALEAYQNINKLQIDARSQKTQMPKIYYQHCL
jgi:hypothetical protein